MSLIVAAAHADVSAGILDRVTDVEAGVVSCGDVASVLRSCEHPGGPDCVICCDLAWARQLVDAEPGLPVILATQQSPDSDLLLSALRAGIADVWALPMRSDAMRERLQAIRARAAASAGVAERRLSQFSQELERDQRAGRYIQMGMLPASPLYIGAFRFEHRIVPSMFMSGDFVDCFPVTERKFIFYIADVAGHGAGSAFVTVLLKNLLRRLRTEQEHPLLSEPGKILEWVNRELLDQRIDKHVAIILGVGDLDCNEIVLVNAGHYPPAIRVSPEGPELLGQRGKPVGLFESVSYDVRAVKLAAGDRLVFVSDGVIDAMGAASLVAREARLLSAAGMGTGLADVWANLAVDGVLRKRDDMTCLVVRLES